MATVRVMEPPSSHVALLHRISSIVSSELSLDEMLGEIVGLTAQVTECDACLVYLLEADSDEVVLRASQVPHLVRFVQAAPSTDAMTAVRESARQMRAVTPPANV